jgi:hypothetical protein
MSRRAKCLSHTLAHTRLITRPNMLSNLPRNLLAWRVGLGSALVKEPLSLRALRSARVECSDRAVAEIVLRGLAGLGEPHVDASGQPTDRLHPFQTRRPSDPFTAGEPCLHVFPDVAC